MPFKPSLRVVTGGRHRSGNVGSHTSGKKSKLERKRSTEDGLPPLVKAKARINLTSVLPEGERLQFLAKARIESAQNYVNFVSPEKVHEVQRNIKSIPDVAFRQLVAEVVRKARSAKNDAAEGSDRGLVKLKEKWIKGLKDSGRDKDFLNPESIKALFHELHTVFRNDSLSPDGEFAEYVISHLAEKDKIKTLLRNVLEYCVLLSSFDQEKREHSFETFPPQGDYLKCVPLTAARVDLLHQLQVSSAEDSILIESYEAVIRQAINELKNTVFEGNEGHIFVYLKYCLGIIDSSQALREDEYYMSAANEISGQFLIDFLSSFSHKVKKLMIQKIGERLSAARERFEEIKKDVEEQHLVAGLAHRLEHNALDIIDSDADSEFFGQIFTRLGDLFSFIPGGSELEVCDTDGEFYFLNKDSFEYYVFLLPKVFKKYFDLTKELRHTDFKSLNKKREVVGGEKRVGFFFSKEGRDHLIKLLKTGNNKDIEFAIDVLWALSSSGFGNGKKVFYEVCNECYRNLDSVAQGVSGYLEPIFKTEKDLMEYKSAFKFRDRVIELRGRFDRMKTRFQNLGRLGLQGFAQKLFQRSRVDFASQFYFISLLEGVGEDISSFSGKGLKDEKRCRGEILSIDDFQTLARYNLSLEARGIKVLSSEFNYHNVCCQFMMRPDVMTLLENLHGQQVTISEGGSDGSSKARLISSDFFEVMAFLAARYDRRDIFEFLLEKGFVKGKAFEFQYYYYDSGDRDNRVTNCDRNIIHYLIRNKWSDLLEKLPLETLSENIYLFVQREKTSRRLAPIFWMLEDEDRFRLLINIIKNVKKNGHKTHHGINKFIGDLFRGESGQDLCYTIVRNIKKHPLYVELYEELRHILPYGYYKFSSYGKLMKAAIEYGNPKFLEDILHDMKCSKIRIDGENVDLFGRESFNLDHQEYFQRDQDGITLFGSESYFDETTKQNKHPATAFCFHYLVHVGACNEELLDVILEASNDVNWEYMFYQIYFIDIVYGRNNSLSYLKYIYQKNGVGIRDILSFAVEDDNHLSLSSFLFKIRTGSDFSKDVLSRKIKDLKALCREEHIEPYNLVATIRAGRKSCGINFEDEGYLLDEEFEEIMLKEFSEQEMVPFVDKIAGKIVKYNHEKEGSGISSEQNEGNKDVLSETLSKYFLNNIDHESCLEYDGFKSELYRLYLAFIISYHNYLFESLEIEPTKNVEILFEGTKAVFRTLLNVVGSIYPNYGYQFDNNLPDVSAALDEIRFYDPDLGDEHSLNIFSKEFKGSLGSESDRYLSSLPPLDPVVQLRAQQHQGPLGGGYHGVVTEV